MNDEDLAQRMADLNISANSSLNNQDQNEDIKDEIQNPNQRQENDGEDRNAQLLAASIELLTRTITMNQQKTVRFNDVEKTFKRFTGNSHSNYNTWNIHFEEQCLLYRLNPTEKFIFAKRLMTKEAKLFIEYESKARNYDELTKELSKEFGQVLNSALIHQRLRDRKKKKEENFTEYFYEMLSLASHSNIDEAAIITYTIEGLPGSIESKAFMYEAQTIAQFKKKFKLS